VEYKGEAFRYFEELMDNIRLQVCTSLFRSATNLIALENIKLMLARSARLEGPGVTSTSAGAAMAPAPARTPVQAGGGDGREPALAAAGGRREIKLPTVTIKRDLPKVGRNDPCPCGSGRKYKHCCGR
ncbi:MAG: SEC-C domain-containing protein, partial [Bryobacter sp.]|nr:SEC-C domain-containing protein [Bryobacter sp.]